MALLCGLKLLAVALLFTGEAVALSPVSLSLEKQDLKPVGVDERSSDDYQSNKSIEVTFEVEGHRVSDVSARWAGKVVYATTTAGIQKYRDMLETQMDTWALKPSREGRYVAVGGNDYKEEWLSSFVLRTQCVDSPPGISCKEATLYAEAAARGADWLYVTGEDNYIHTRNVEAFLEKQDPNEAVAIGVVGCGKGMYCNESSSFAEFGGFCGGAGYMVSRAALRLLLAGGAPSLIRAYEKSPLPNDVTASCHFRKNDIALRYPGDGFLFGGPMFMIEDYTGRIRENKFFVMHYVLPPMVKWIHAQVEGADAVVKKKLELEAFDNGCGRGMNKTCWMKEFTDCQRVHR